MSWISEFANRAENLLNTLDNSAAEALRHNAPTEPGEMSHFSRWDDEVYSADQPRRDSVPPTEPQLGDDAVERRPTGWMLDESWADDKVNSTTSLSHISHMVSKAPDLHPSIEPHDSAWDDTSFVTSGIGSSSSSLLKTSFKHHVEQDREETRRNAGAKSVNSTSSSGYTGNSNLPSSSAVVDHEPAHGQWSKPSVNAVPAAVTLHEGGSDSDIRLENKLLRSEVSSLSLEVSGLLRRNHKAADENKQLRGQVERISGQLQDSDSRVRELQVTVRELSDSAATASAASDPKDNQLREDEHRQLTQRLASVEGERNAVQRELNVTKQALTDANMALQESRQQTSLVGKRAELSQKEVVRITRDLAQYKEKAAHILQLKEQLIASLRGHESSSTAVGQPPSPPDCHTDHNTYAATHEELEALKAECDMLRQESARWRLEVDNREMAVQELEIQMHAEWESLRRNLDIAEQRADRECQLREDADGEIVHLRRRIGELEDISSRQKTEVHDRLMNSEAEVNRLRRLVNKQRHLAANSPGYCADQSPDEHVVALETRLHQMTDSLLVKQDALDSVLAQNHALKIRLERAKSDNESLVQALSPVEDANGVSRLLPLPTAISSVYGCARLNLQRSGVPYSLWAPLIRLDSITCRLTNGLRRLPLLRLVLFTYLVLLHGWLLLASAFFLPPSTLPVQSGAVEKVPADNSQAKV